MAVAVLLLRCWRQTVDSAEPPGSEGELRSGGRKQMEYVNQAEP